MLAAILVAIGVARQGIRHLGAPLKLVPAFAWLLELKAITATIMHRGYSCSTRALVADCGTAQKYPEMSATLEAPIATAAPKAIVLRSLDLTLRRTLEISDRR